MTGDYQPAERKFELSRKVLEVCLELGFPVAVLERSPLVLRDLELLQDVNDRATAVVFFSTICTPDSRGYEPVREMENLAPAMEKRFEAMERIAGAGILTGTRMMPILPGLCDDDANLQYWGRGWWRRSRAGLSSIPDAGPGAALRTVEKPRHRDSERPRGEAPSKKRTKASVCDFQTSYSTVSVSRLTFPESWGICEGLEVFWDSGATELPRNPAGHQGQSIWHAHSVRRAEHFAMIQRRVG